MDGWGGERQIGKTLAEIEPKHIERYNLALKYVNNNYVLDAACGCGYGSSILSKKAKGVTSVDYSKDAIDYAKKHWGRYNVDFQQFNLNKAGYAGYKDLGKFDVIVSFETIEHLPVPIISTLTKFNQILKPGGILIISHPENEPKKPLGSLMLRLTYHHHFQIDGKKVRNVLEHGLGMEILEDWNQPGRSVNFPYHILVARK